jgi:hypothetical protein
VKPFGQMPIVVQSIAQNLSPSGASRHASEGLLQSTGALQTRHCCPRSGTQIESPSMIAQ